jgi:RNA polymerase sigma factor (sigma-70 family)
VAPPDFRQLLDERLKSEEPLLRAYLKRRLWRHEDVGDYVQEVYARVLATPPTAEVSNWRGLLRRIAANLVIDRSRRDRTRAASDHVEIEDDLDQFDEQPSAERVLIARERLAAVAEALKHASPVARSGFFLWRVVGLCHSAPA